MSGDGEWGRDTLSPFTWMCEKEINNRDGLKTNVIFDWKKCEIFFFCCKGNIILEEMKNGQRYWDYDQIRKN